MRSVPLERRHLPVLVLPTVLPSMPLVFLVVQARDVLRTLAGLPI